jgi:hypothetical protein
MSNSDASHSFILSDSDSSTIKRISFFTSQPRGVFCFFESRAKSEKKIRIQNYFVESRRWLLSRHLLYKHTTSCFFQHGIEGGTCSFKLSQQHRSEEASPVGRRRTFDLKVEERKWWPEEGGTL